MLKPAALAAALALSIVGSASAQQPAPPPAAPPPYGNPITLDQAKKAADAAEAEAKKNNWLMAIAVASPSGDLVYFRKLDGTQYASIQIAQHKAKAAATFRRPTKVFQDGLAAGNHFLLTLDGIIASEGGVPIIVEGKVVGAIGVSGGTGQQDGVVATAGINAIK
jgi:glc operon protein GlcG